MAALAIAALLGAIASASRYAQDSRAVGWSATSQDHTLLRIGGKMSEVTIFAQGSGWVVVDKPAGLLSAPGRRVSDSVVTRLHALGFEGAAVVHRLDMDTSGLLVVATTPSAHRALSLQFQRRSVTKAYIARLDGRVDADRGRIALSFRLDPNDRPRQVFDPVHGRLGVTSFEVLERSQQGTRIRLWPLTGRTHQLRVHAAHRLGLGAAIVGDPLYGQKGDRLALDADQLSLDCPTTGRRRYFRRYPAV